MPPVRFEPTISGGELPQTYDLDRAATGTGEIFIDYSEKTSNIAPRQEEFVGLRISVDFPEQNRSSSGKNRQALRNWKLVQIQN